MGLGDQLMATGFARGAKDRGKRIAFGDGTRILWDGNSPAMFQGNPNIAPPGSERQKDIEWVPFYKGNRLYNKLDKGRWIWNYDFRPIAGEVYFTDKELAWADAICTEPFIVIEPNVPLHKSSAINKQWPVERYRDVALEMMKRFPVYQFNALGGYRLPNSRLVKSPTFRQALAVMRKAKLYIGPEGGLHHGAAAVGIPAVVIFGGFIPPQVTGYDGHVNLAGPGEACGSLNRCAHCLKALDQITVGQVCDAVQSLAVS